MAEISVRNRLLASLRPEALERFTPHLQRLHLERGATQFDPEQDIRHVWFPESGVVLLIITMGEGGSAEAATIGAEGAVGLVSALGGHRSLTRAVVQVPGDLLRLPAAVLHEAFEASPGIRQCCLCYADALLAQVLQSSACAALHPVEARLCRWLLEVQDRVQAKAVLPLTHEFLAEMLGVHRTTVTTAARVLQQAGLVAYRRGQVVVLDRAGLEEVACECYATIHAHHQRLLHYSG